ncbi:piercer of microtubule wall 1 protein isoform X2 [Plodia interpunctella]|uniref:piercer of microtubule wall 1 protein isoform X2 n=1 Tax=Plodia interpunctella TaxID=58824 RepID=UPI0023689F2F|nr:piercer of microtubule wall 1 protein isoform X2 [Plodia interpunctella]
MGDDKPAEGARRPGFCSSTPVDKASLRAEIRKPPPKTSDLFITCNLPKRFEHPHWFNGYGCQVSNQHPFYRTSASVYGWYPPGLHSVPTTYFPKSQAFTESLAQAGMYRNYSLNTNLDPLPYN